MTRDGTLVTIGGRLALRFERRYRHPVERVWRAVSEPGEMAAWFPSNVEGDRAIGAELAFVDDAQRAAAIDAGEPTRVDGPMFHGTVVAYDPPTVFAFTWGGELLRFELLPDGEGTLLVLTQVLSHQSVAARNGAGWHQCLAQLDHVLGEGGGAGADGWEDACADYLHRMGPALGAPAGDGSMTWERATHVDADRVRSVTTDPALLAAWGASERASDPLRWEIAPTEHGTAYRLTHAAIGDDADLAAAWHALLVQLDMYLAAGQLVPVDHEPWVEAYAAVL